MGYEPLVLENFGGLDLSNDPYRAGLETASVATNIVPDGSIRTRGGFDNFTASAAAAEYSQLYEHSAAKLLAHRGTTLAAIATDGSEATTTTVVNNFVHAARFGTPSASYSYIADASTTLIRYDGSSFTSGAASATVDGVGGLAQPKGNFLTVTGSSNRLVVAGTASSGGPNGLTSGGSYVWFSDPGSGETWDSNNYVQLDPGDGESITGCCTWRDQVYVFKQTKMFIFYSETTNDAGDPIFNKRSVSLGPDASILTPSADNGNATLVAAPEGIYYVGPAGVWLTTGDVPVSVTDPKLRGYRPSFTADLNLSGRSATGAWRAVKPGIHYHEGLVLVPIDPDQALPTTRVFDTYRGEWASWSARVKGYATWRNGLTDTLHSAARDVNSVGKHVVAWDPGFSTENGAAFLTSASYFSNWSDLGIPDEKTVAEIEVWGIGSPTITLTADPGTTRSVSQAVTLGVSDVQKAIVAKAIWGTYFQLQVTTSAAFKIERIVLHLREANPTGRQTTAT